MTNLISLIRLLLIAVLPVCGKAGDALPRATPESQGVSSTALLKFVQALDEEIDGVHSVMVLRNGKVITEGWWTPYASDHNHVLYSLSKSFTSSAVGFAVAEGKLSIDDKVLKFFPDEAPTDPSGNLKAMRVRDLLTMTTGHQNEPSPSPDVVSAKSFLAHEVPHQPGTHFKYNTAATFMQSAIVQKLTGQTVLDYLRPRLFEPLGIDRPMWDTNFQGVSLGGYGLRVRTEDIAKLGQLYLQKGNWNGKQLLPQQWVKMAVGKQVSNGMNPGNDWNQGYGFQFWRCRHNAYRGDGAFGQYCIVIPEKGVVVAITSGVRDMAAVMNMVWNRLLPALQSEELPADNANVEKLGARLTQLTVKPAEGLATSSIEETALNRKYVFPRNEQKIEALSLGSNDGGKTLTLNLTVDGRSVKFPAGFRSWKKGRAPFSGGRLAQFADEPVAGTFAWKSMDTAVVKICAYETPFHVTYALKFKRDSVRLDAEANVAFGPSKRPSLTGHAARIP